jgi:hypothetical protein
VIGTYLDVVGPRQRRWGATREEVARGMPGDALLRRDAPSTTRATTIDASPEVVFPWLLQIGYGRGGWYSYDWIDNDGKPSVERIRGRSSWNRRCSGGSGISPRGMKPSSESCTRSG